ncbi:hypothetical protein OE88DRAFT_1202843 [Heliocybe sulcata]|uniref:Uncharacterized protein n=1 Tax=Heliocybe sulcata TaxID=5364 RepID=A0A5C3NC80_9AGAM|nr:hypothetical protein OE88DRAFT_1202843 [Heliocybe sulcata]
MIPPLPGLQAGAVESKAGLATCWSNRCIPRPRRSGVGCRVILPSRRPFRSRCYIPPLYLLCSYLAFADMSAITSDVALFHFLGASISTATTMEEVYGLGGVNWGLSCMGHWCRRPQPSA